MVGERRHQPINTSALAIMVAGGRSPVNELAYSLQGQCCKSSPCPDPQPQPGGPLLKKLRPSPEPRRLTKLAETPLHLLGTHLNAH